eukprot:3765744-Amphidinium_carterae.1
MDLKHQDKFKQARRVFSAFAFLEFCGGAWGYKFWSPTCACEVLTTPKHFEPSSVHESMLRGFAFAYLPARNWTVRRRFSGLSLADLFSFIARPEVPLTEELRHELH